MIERVSLSEIITNPNIAEIFGNKAINDMLENIQSFAKMISDYTQEKETVMEKRKRRAKRKLTNEEIFNDVKHFVTKVLNKNISFKVVNGEIFLFIKEIKKGYGLVFDKGFAKITYSPEKERYNVYIVSKNYRQKICSLIPGREDYSGCVIKFLNKALECLTSEDFEFIDFTEQIDRKQKTNYSVFDNQLFIKNIQDDLGIELTGLHLRPSNLTGIAVTYNGDKKLTDVIGYIEDYIKLMRDKGIIMADEIKIRNF